MRVLIAFTPPPFQVMAPASPIKAKPMPHFSAPVYTRASDKSEVEVCPFSFEEREKERRALKEKRLEDLRNQEVRTKRINQGVL